MTMYREYLSQHRRIDTYRARLSPHQPSWICEKGWRVLRAALRRCYSHHAKIIIPVVHDARRCTHGAGDVVTTTRVLHMLTLEGVVVGG